jgi:hypothetical protein
VNAAAATTTNAPSALIAMLAAPRAAAHAPAAQTQPGFTSLIKVLLGPRAAEGPAPQSSAALAPEPKPAASQVPVPQSVAPASPLNDTEDSQTEASLPAPQAAVASAPVAATQLADAMIRSMLTSAGNVASLNASGPGAPRKWQARAMQDPAQPNTPDAPVVPPALMAMTQSPLFQSADTARGAGRDAAKGIASKLPFGATVLPAAVAKTPTPAPLAFSMRITPVTESTPKIASQAAPTSPLPAAAQQTVPAAAQVSMPAADSQPAPNTQDSTQPAASEATSTDVKAPGTDTKTKQDAQTHGEPAPIVTPSAAVASAAVAPANDGTGDFARPIAEAISTTVSATGKGQDSDAPSAEQALRSAEPSAPAAPAQSTGPVKEIAVRIATPQAPAVDVHLVERAGQLHVAVRTADGGLQTSLRQDLGSLVNSLGRAGYRAEAITPREASPAAAISAQTNSQNGGRESESGSGSRNGNAGDTSQNPGGGQQQRQDQQRRDSRQPKWIEELENQQ